MATPGQGPDRAQEVAYTDAKVIGNGSFGVVYQAKLCETGELVAIKKVLQDKRFKVSLRIEMCIGFQDVPNKINLCSFFVEPRAADNAAIGALQHRQIEVLFLFQWRKGKTLNFHDEEINFFFKGLISISCCYFAER